MPPNVTIASQNSLLPYLSQRDNFYLLLKVGDTDYIAVDLEDGPNKFSPLSNSHAMELLVNGLIHDNRYKIVWQKNKSILLKRI